MSGGGVSSEFSVTIPELEEMVRNSTNKSFSDEEDKIILAYFGRVPRQKLVELLNKKFSKLHTIEQVKHRHKRLTEQIELNKR